MRTESESKPQERMGKKLIIPAEVKICATCSYWDGARKVDPELQVVVVEEGCEGKCLVQEECRRGMTDEFKFYPDCLWEHIAADDEPSNDQKN